MTCHKTQQLIEHSAKERLLHVVGGLEAGSEIKHGTETVVDGIFSFVRWFMLMQDLIMT